MKDRPLPAPKSPVKAPTKKAVTKPEPRKAGTGGALRAKAAARAATSRAKK